MSTHPSDVWQWVPNEVKYYVARTGQQVGLTQRNYKRYIGILLESKWNLEEIEVGVNDKTYDAVTGQFYYEKKIVKMKVGSLIDFQWIKERISEPEFAARIDAEEQKEEGGELMPEYDKIEQAKQEMIQKESEE